MKHAYFKPIHFAAFCFVISLHTKAQTGPGGVGNATNNPLWLVAEGNTYTDAGSTRAVNGSAVQQWKDISGNNKHAIQTTATFKPVLQTNQVNGFAVLRFDGLDDRILSENIGTSGKATIFVVVRHVDITSAPGVNIGIIQGSPDGKAFSNTEADKSVGIWTNGSLSKLSGRGVQSDGTQKDLTPGASVAANTFYIITQQYDGSSITQLVDAGNPDFSEAYDGTLQDWQDFGIGRQGSQSLDGDIAEVIVYTTFLNTAQRNIVQNYLAAKYNKRLSLDDFYLEDDTTNGNYDFEVAGIATEEGEDNENLDAQGTGIVRVLEPTNMDPTDYFFWGHDNQPAVVNEFTDVPAGVSARLQRVWRITEWGDIGNIKVRFDLSELGTAVSAGSLRLIVDDDNNGSFTDATVLSGATALGDNVYEFDAVSALNDNLRFTLGVAESSAPVLAFTITRFKAVETALKQVEVVWTTELEQANSYYTVERSKNGMQWEAVQQFESRGSSSVRSNYRFIDDIPYAGISFYRLRQTDPTGEIHYSNSEKVFISQPGTNELLYPNPATNEITINGNNIALNEIKIFDLTGKNVMQFVYLVTTSRSEIVLDVSRLKPGHYIVKTATGTYRMLKK